MKRIIALLSVLAIGSTAAIAGPNLRICRGEYALCAASSTDATGRGTIDHKWRVFEGEKEYLFKNFKVNVPCYNELAMGD